MNKTRRKFIKGGIIAGASCLAGGGFPSIRAAAALKPKIRVLGTHVTLQEAIRQKAEADLGIDIEFYPGGSAEVLYQASTQPDSFDIYEQWSNSINVLWNAAAIQPIDIRKLDYWSEINDLTKKGKITATATEGMGDAPNKILYVQKNGTLGRRPSQQVSFMPYVHNTDSFGYNSNVIAEGVPYKTESWGWLLDEKYQRKVALVNEPTIGLFDAALAAQAKGLMDFKDMGNMTRAEINQLFEILVEYRRKGHFRGVWTSVSHSVKLMSQGEVDIESMFSPAVSSLKGMGIPCIYAAPKEGYRAWHGVMCLSATAQKETEDAAYQFMNWWLSGWAGAFIARQGYYIANPERSRKLMAPEEWDYWYEGKEAAVSLKGTDGKVSVNVGERRRGGSYVNRFSHIAVWNTVMENYDYTLLKWNEFLES